MTLHDSTIRMRHMRDHAGEAIDMLGQQPVEVLRDNRMLQLALVQLIEIVGEAAARIPANMRQRHPSVPWQMAADMRNKLIHGYDIIEHGIIYDTVKNDLPPLVTQLQQILEPENG